ncbi:hypothetical protein SAMN05421866_0726 [Chryseobacterium oranimense]|uniref:Uncharacterized protein n=1 Tax=Chryseobacterium oranimense TaxID=421058 RepID=A0A1M5KJ92_9FLAO|nr:hypothetical protein [Chryseobacterium oranimense]SHG52778.1 hypothetical protein SAMN05421866_0726 [Chryseobacterium oranimense]
MKTFAKYDFYIQLLILIIGIISIFTMDNSFIGGLSFHFIVGISQLISYIIKLFFKEEKSILFIIYGVFIMPIWISLLLLVIFKSQAYNLLLVIPFFGVYYSPILALVYIFDAYKFYQYQK